MEESLDTDLTHESLIHDLNNVFETITEAAELLSGDRRWKPLAATLCRSVNRGKRLLGAIPDSTPILASVIDDAIQSVMDYCIAARKPRMRFVRQIPTGTRLPGSAKDWERVFANLFLNAAQIMQKPGRIDIMAQHMNGSLTISISDNGPGIPPDLLARVFRPNVSTKTNNSGRSGLGLHIVSSIVKKYSGRVSAANRERANGAVFTISVPAN
ncbi:MAG: GHKL domain-containing protein [Acidobacteriaceae bacterium]|nr:GHKL domain-containing protein [Acidobacteriaceae bacterium]MBV9296195.1 GHKL domain-containing protein [Acidobacteriaceae bacterium]MBV9767640.1 GHKL domain-containing protein [Acidobacteriaceae bacterium]